MKKHLIYQRKSDKKSKDRDRDEFSSGDTLEHSIKARTSQEEENENFSPEETESNDLTISEVRI